VRSPQTLALIAPSNHVRWSAREALAHTAGIAPGQPATRGVIAVAGCSAVRCSVSKYISRYGNRRDQRFYEARRARLERDETKVRTQTNPRLIPRLASSPLHGAHRGFRAAGARHDRR
jgi:hypothetical protein